MKKTTRHTIPKLNMDIKTIRQLKFWLQGIQEFQNSDWVPDSKQWKRIYDIIMTLDENYAEPMGVHGNMMATTQQSNLMPVMTQPVSLYDGNIVPPEASLPLSQLKQVMERKASQPTAVIKTPDIQQGSYVSTLAG